MKASRGSRNEAPPLRPVSPLPRRALPPEAAPLPRTAPSSNPDDQDFRRAFLEGPIDQLSDVLRQLREELDRVIGSTECSECNKRALRNQYAERALGIHWAAQQKPVAHEGDSDSLKDDL